MVQSAVYPHTAGEAPASAPAVQTEQSAQAQQPAAQAAQVQAPDKAQAAQAAAANPDAGDQVDNHPWWFWPGCLLVFCFVLGIIAVMAGVGGGVLFVPLVSGFFPFHLDFVRGAGLMVALAGALAAGPGLLRRNLASLRLTLPVALIASAGVAVSLAVQGALGNFVGGLMLLILKPIRAGEYVKVGEHEGTVRAVKSFYTELVTADNRNISLPNSSLTNTAIVNYTREGTRRLDIEFGIAYGADIASARAALMELAANTDGISREPAPAVLMSECADSAVKLMLRIWCDQKDYWRLKFELTEGGKLALDRAGVEIAFPQMDVHIRN